MTQIIVVLIVLGMMIPGAVIIQPIIQILLRVGLVGTIPGLILVNIAGSLPFPALAALAVLPLSLGAARQLQRHRHDVSRLAPAIQASIAAALGHAVLLSAGLALSRVI